MDTSTPAKWTRRCAVCAAAMMGVALFSCVDDNYDLSDIDTSVRVQTQALSLPVNIDQITLSDIVNITDDSRVKVIDGRYAIVEDGSVDTEDINISPIHIAAPVTTPSTTVVETSPAMRAAVAEFNIATRPVDFEFVTHDVSSHIHSIDCCYGEMDLTIALAVSELEGRVSSMELSNVVMTLPKGLIIADPGYDRASGLYSIDRLTSSANRFEVTLHVTGFDFTRMGDVFNPSTHTINFDGKMNLSGRLTIDPAKVSGDMPTSLTLVNSFTFTDFDVTEFDGEFSYNISDFHIPDVDLSDIPGVFNQDGTSIRLVNPVIYLQLDNPLQAYDVYARTGLEITATLRNSEQKVYSIDNGTFQVGPGIPTGIYNYAISPAAPANPDPDFSPAEHVAFTALSDVLTGDGLGLPTRLSVDLVNPEVPVQKVYNFPVGRNVGQINGKYRFVAPLELAVGSTVQYTDTIDGWWSEDLNDLTITYLVVTAEISTDIPMAVDFIGWPIDRDGNRINNVEVKGARVMANANHQRLHLYITGEIKGLDGIYFSAQAAAEEEQTLQPGMTITLNNILASASAYFDHEL